MNAIALGGAKPITLILLPEYFPENLLYCITLSCFCQYILTDWLKERALRILCSDFQPRLLQLSILSARLTAVFEIYQYDCCDASALIERVFLITT